MCVSHTFGIDRVICIKVCVWFARMLMNMCVCVCVYTNVCTHSHTGKFLHVHIYMYNICIYIYTHISTYIQPLSFPWSYVCVPCTVYYIPTKQCAAEQYQGQAHPHPHTRKNNNQQFHFFNDYPREKYSMSNLCARQKIACETLLMHETWSRGLIVLLTSQIWQPPRAW